MALTLDNKTVFSLGNRRAIVADADFDNSYAAGGESLTPQDLGFTKRIEALIATASGGYEFEYDYTNKKLKALVEFITVTATVDLANHTAVASVNTTGITLTGINATDLLTPIPPDTLEAGISVVKAWATAADTATLRTTNASAGAINPASASWSFLARLASGAKREAKSATDLSGLTNARVFAIGV